MVRSALAILDALQAEINNDPLIEPGQDDDDESLEIHPSHHASPASSRLEFASYASSSSSPSSVVGLGDKHKLLALRLSPLRRIETVLKKRLGAGSEEVRNAPSQDMQATPFESPQVPPGKHRRAAEFVVRTWSDALQGRAAANHHTAVDEYDAEEVTDVIAGCQEDLIALWNDPVVRKVLSSRRIPIEHSAGLCVSRLAPGSAVLILSVFVASWMTCNASLSVRMSLPMTMWCARAFERWVFRSIGSYLNKVRSPGAGV